MVHSSERFIVNADLNLSDWIKELIHKIKYFSTYIHMTIRRNLVLIEAKRITVYLLTVYPLKTD
jgi:hypothetical protein